MEDETLMVLFAGEQPSLDNAFVDSNFNAPRNIAMVRVSKDLLEVLSPGATEIGGFYNFGGGWTAQENKGIHWLTDLTPVATHPTQSEWEAATRIKAMRTRDDNVFVVYEVWTASEYIRTEFFIVSKAGTFIIQPTILTKGNFRMAPTDEVFRPINAVIGVDGTDQSKDTIIVYGAQGSRLVRYIIAPFISAPTPAPFVDPRAPRSAAANEELYRSADGIWAGIVLIVIAVAAFLIILALLIVVLIIVGTQSKLQAPTTIALEAVVLLHPSPAPIPAETNKDVENEDADGGNTAPKVETMWIVGAIVATLLRAGAALMAWSMWIAALSSLATEGPTVNSNTGPLQEPARGWATAMLILSIIMCVFDTFLLLLQALPFVQLVLILKANDSPALRSAIRWILELPHALLLSQGSLLVASIVVAFGAGATSTSTNEGYVYTTVVLYLTLPIRFIIWAAAGAALVQTQLLPRVLSVLTKTTKEKSAETLRTRESFHCEPGEKPHDSEIVGSTVDVKVAVKAVQLSRVTSTVEMKTSNPIQDRQAGDRSSGI